MIPYIEDFYTQKEADEALEFIRSQPFVRPPNKRNKTSRKRRLSFPGYSPDGSAGEANAAEYDVSGTIEDAPEIYKRIADGLGEYAVSQRLPVPVNYLSTIGYLLDDHVYAHQHKEDRKLPDATVYVVSFGAVHPIAIRSGATPILGYTKKGKPKYGKFVPDGKDDYVIHPKHGSLYVLPSSFNQPGSGNEHQHEVLEGTDYSYGGLRISINCKHIPTGLSPEDMKKACSRPAGGPHSKQIGWLVRKCAEYLNPQDTASRKAWMGDYLQGLRKDGIIETWAWAPDEATFYTPMTKPPLTEDQMSVMLAEYCEYFDKENSRLAACLHSAGWRGGTTCVQCGLVSKGKYKDFGSYRPKPGAWTHPTLGLRVWCCRDGYEKPPQDAIYVGRANSRGRVKFPKSPFGNHGKIDNEKAFRKYATALVKSTGHADEFLSQIQGKDLICWCVPSEPWCHARVWLEIANS